MRRLGLAGLRLLLFFSVCFFTLRILVGFFDFRVGSRIELFFFLGSREIGE